VESDAGPRGLRGVGAHLRLAWPVFVVFLVQRLMTVGFVVAVAPDELWRLTLRWDAGWYLRLAEGGYVYPNLAADGQVKASNLAYFPLFPWLVRHLAHTGIISYGGALLAVSWLGGLLAVWAIFAVGNAWYGRGAGIGLAALWGTAPASLPLTMGYPEGLFTAAAAAALLCLIRRRPILAGCCGIVAGLLRPTAVAVIAMIGAYAVVEVARWIATRRQASGRHGIVAGDEPAPLRAVAGVLLSTAGLGAFMAYVGVRTGEVFGYFTVQGQWGQRTAGFGEYWQGMAAGLFASDSGSLVPVDIVVALGYVALFCLIVFDRRLAWASVYAAGVLLITLSHITFQHVYLRQLLPAFVLLIPLVRMRVPRAGAITALTLVSIAVAWGSALFLLDPGSAL